MIPSGLWKLLSGRGRGCSEKQSEIFLICRREYCACNSHAIPIATGGSVTLRPALVNKVSWSSGVLLVNILHPEWVPFPKKIRKWALPLLSFVPLKPKDQPCCGALVFINYHITHMTSCDLPSKPNGTFSNYPLWQVRKPRPRGVAWLLQVTQPQESQGGPQITEGESVWFIALPQTSRAAS